MIGAQSAIESATIFLKIWFEESGSRNLVQEKWFCKFGFFFLVREKWLIRKKVGLYYKSTYFRLEKSGFANLDIFFFWFEKSS